ncbi:MAG: NAD(P)-dependent oxidoreductase [Akkermansiaceae bacterium]
MPHAIHLGWKLSPQHLDWIKDQLGDDACVSQGKEIPEHTQILVQGRLPDEEFDRLAQLETLVIPFAGLPAETRVQLLDRPQIQVHNLHHNASSTAEMAIALMLAASKRIIPHDAALRQGRWMLDESPVPSSMAGKRLMILGYGAIGQRVARICQAMDMVVSVYKKSPPTDASQATEGVNFLTHENWQEELAKTDIIQLCLPGTEETHHIIGAKQLEQLPQHACIVNTGRGSLIDEEALYQGLRSQQIGAAALDVWWNYPKKRSEDICLPSQFPFHELENVVLTPHRAGDLGDDSLEQRRLDELCGILRDLINGDTARNRVDVQRGY